jgi:hypothetical protein
MLTDKTKDTLTDFNFDFWIWGGSRDTHRIEIFIISWPKFTPENLPNPNRHLTKLYPTKPKLQIDGNGLRYSNRELFRMDNFLSEFDRHPPLGFFINYPYII